MLRQTPQWLGYTVAVLACLLVLVASTLLGQALSQRRLRPPNLHLHAGKMHLLGFVSYPTSFFTPSAYMPPGTRCGSTNPGCRPWRAAPSYVIWIIDSSRFPSDPQGAYLTFLSIPLSFSQLAESLST